MKVAVFDFCETLVDFQTADEFIRYIISVTCPKTASSILMKLKIKTTLIKIIHRLGLGKSLKTKELYLNAISGVAQDEIRKIAEAYYHNRVKPHVIETIIKELKRYKQAGYRIVILSGGYKEYIDFFAKDYAVDDVIANNIQFRDKKSTGKLKDQDCVGAAKVKRFDDFTKNIEDQVEEVIFFTDSIVDKPFMKNADRTVIVSHNRHQKWVDLDLYEEIVW